MILSTLTPKRSSLRYFRLACPDEIQRHPVRLRHPFGGGLPREFASLSNAERHKLVTASGIGKKADYGFRECHFILRIHQDGRIIGNFREGAAIGANDGRPTLHRFQNGQPETSEIEGKTKASQAP